MTQRKEGGSIIPSNGSGITTWEWERWTGDPGVGMRFTWESPIQYSFSAFSNQFLSKSTLRMLYFLKSNLDNISSLFLCVRHRASSGISHDCSTRISYTFHSYRIFSEGILLHYPHLGFGSVSKKNNIGWISPKYDRMRSPTTNR